VPGAAEIGVWRSFYLESSNMRKSLIIPLLAILVAESAVGGPAKLNCVVTDGSRNSQTATLQIDIEMRKLKFGDFSFDIVQVNENYISAIMSTDGVIVGGEVLVINRMTGQLRRATVYLAATADTFLKPTAKLHETMELTAKVFSGTCTKPVL
jgi:hypothetical protein